jgi:CHAT domain-containing protein/tetratricopeptide (TPR) repeat protein
MPRVKAPGARSSLIGGPVYAWLLILVVLQLAVSNALAQEEQAAIELVRGRPITKSLEPGERHEFIIQLEAGQAATVGVRQRGIDVVLTVTRPDGGEGHRVDRPNVEWGREAITVVAQETGPHRLTISPLHRVGPGGRYRVDVTRVAGASARDRQRVEAERDVTAAEVARSTNTIGGCRTAVERFQRAASSWRALHEPYEEGVALYGLALAYRFLGAHEDSLQFLERVLALMRRVGDPHGLVIAHSGLGWTYLYLDNYDIAASHFRQALSHRGAGDRRGTASDLFGLAWTDLLLLRPAEALATFNKALVLRTSALDRRGEALTLVGRAAALNKLRRWEEAVVATTAALEIHQNYPDRYGQADALTVKAWALLHGGQPQTALDVFREAAEVRRGLGDAAGEAAALHGQAATLDRMRDQRSALELTDRALTLVESVRAERSDHDLRAMYFASVQELYDLRIGLLLQQYRMTRDPEAARSAFAVSERARARSLLDLLARRGASRGKPESGTGRRASDPSESAGTPGVHPVTIPDVQQMLDAETTLLAYAIGPSGSVLWAIAHDQFAIYELAPFPEIQRAARDLLEDIADLPSRSTRGRSGNSDDLEGIRQRANTLARLVLPEQAVRQAHRRIVVVPSGPLQLVPFELLPLSAAPTAASLVDRHEIVGLPSASTIRGLRRTSWQSVSGQKVAVFADPVMQRDDARVRVGMMPDSAPRRGVADRLGDLPRLFASRWEAREIARLVPSANAMIATDFNAARRTLKRLDLATFSILHFGTHAIVDPDRFDRSGLVLSLVDEQGQPVDGFIRAPEILRWSLNADLVVLSGCRTGIGREIRGEGLMALSRSFLAAGASRLVTSLWPVDDKATAYLMARFYRRTLGPERLAPAAALRAAQLEMRAEPRWRSPYYWAGFVLQGEWH